VFTRSCRKARPDSSEEKDNGAEVHIGLDGSLAGTAICVLGEKGTIVTDAGFEAVLMETRQVKAALKAMGRSRAPDVCWRMQSRRRSV